MSDSGLSKPGLCNQDFIFSTTLNEQYKAIYYSLKNLLNPDCPNNISMYDKKHKVVNNNLVLINKYFNNKNKIKLYMVIINSVFILFSLICIIKVFNN